MVLHGYFSKLCENERILNSNIYTEFNDAWIDQSRHTSFKVGFVDLREVLYIVECLTLDSEDPTLTSYTLHCVALHSLHIQYFAFLSWQIIHE